MDIFQALALGVVQGITEFFPVSSSGHLVILQSLFGMKEPQVAFDIFLHVGTSAAVIIFFWKDVLKLFTDDRKTLYLILTASVPTFVIGFFLKDAAETFFGAARMVGYMLIVSGIWLALASRMALARKAENKELGFVNSVIIGVSQGIAVIPGISRSGTTIATGMLLGLDKEKACKFSFLLSLPAVLGAAALKSRKIVSHLVSGDMFCYLAGGMAAMLVGIAAIRVLLAIARGGRFYIFGAYCILAGVLVLIFL